MGKRTTWTLTGLQQGVQYYFAVQAQSTSGLSPLSSQVAYVTPLHNAPASEPARSDFNNDGKFDILWQNQKTGQLLAWHMNGASIVSTRSLSPNAVSPEWKLRGSGDFNGDGKADLVWQNIANGAVAFYLMDGTLTYSTGSFTPSQVDPRWEIASVRDMNGDGHPDLLWNRVDTGQVLAWYMNGTTRASQGWLNPNPLGDPNWRLRGTGDFDRDGRPDLVWQHESTGQPLLWKMGNGHATGSSPLPSPGIGAWKIRSIGDANADGWPDLIFEHATQGHVVIWAMHGTSVFSGPYISTVDPAWLISAPR